MFRVAALAALSACTAPGAAPGAAAPSPVPAPPPGPGKNLLKASTFDDGKSIPWATSFTAPAEGLAEIEAGAFCVEVRNKGNKRWDAQFRHREIVIQRGHAYTIQFKAWASAPTKARPKVGMSGPPYAEYWSSTIELGTSPQTFVGRFTMMQNDDPTAELAFHIGGDMALAAGPYRICIDDIRLDDPEFAGHDGGTGNASEAPKLAVNQVGYWPKGIKLAALRNGSTTPTAWELLDSSGKRLANGKTLVFGNDAASGEHVHLIDFSAFETAGTGYVLVAGDEKSVPFDVSAELYSKMKYDALAYFYHNRSGIEIAMPFAGEPSLARPAGHVSDKSVPCKAGTGCDYSLDVAGGWYDAGDHGKYVVNGGISAWTLLNLYERTRYLGTSLAELGDGRLAIPENANRVPDILDEARWQLEFLLKMMVPEGKPLAGMVHHKIHDEAWTALGVAPHEANLKRWLHKPSTAATLNVAATAAQAARIWQPLDTAFAARCLASAERAWAAARKNPGIFASPKDDQGGGAYADDDVQDEFYAAAAELWLTTGKPEYRQYLQASPLHARFPTQAGGHVSSMNWQVTDALGMISIAVVPGKDGALQKEMRRRITRAADAYLATQKKEGYRTPLQSTADGKYVWGSNSFVLNNMIVLALANDFTKQQKYLDGVVLGMDYLLGRNPLAQSYVTGYGERALQNPHHRFWARQASGKYPAAPPGVVSGGPNSNIEDPYSKAAGLQGCAPQKCFVDHIEAWSVNEITINWNAPFAWTAAWLDEKSRR